MTNAAALRVANTYLSARDGDAFDARWYLGTERTMWFDRMVAHAARVDSLVSNPSGVMDGVEPTDDLFAAVAEIINRWCEID